MNKEKIEKLIKENEHLKAELKLYTGTLKRNHLLNHKCNELEEQNEELKKQLKIKNDGFMATNEELIEYAEENEELKQKIKWLLNDLSNEIYFTNNENLINNNSDIKNVIYYYLLLSYLNKVLKIFEIEKTTI